MFGRSPEQLELKQQFRDNKIKTYEKTLNTKLKSNWYNKSLSNYDSKKLYNITTSIRAKNNSTMYPFKGNKQFNSFHDLNRSVLLDMQKALQQKRGLAYQTILSKYYKNSKPSRYSKISSWFKSKKQHPTLKNTRIKGTSHV